MQKKLIAIVCGISLIVASGLVYADSNIGTIEQAGLHNVAATTQIGDANNAYTLQDGALNKATSLQDGAQNVSTIKSYGVGNKADGAQYGRNFLDIEQVGGGNDASVKQGSDGAPVSNYHQPSYAGDWIHGSFVNQDGVFNKASVEVTGSSDSTRVNQKGLFNAAVQKINTYDTKSNNPARAGAQIDQDGVHNYASQTTEKSFGMFGINGILIHQDGNDNKSTQYAKGGTYSLMEAWIHGDDNDTDQNLDGFNSHAYIDIIGDGNNVSQDQKYTVWSVGGADTADAIIRGDHNTSSQSQLGEHNSSTVDVYGDRNTALTDQVGDDNIADIDICGDENLAKVVQYGNDNLGNVLQNGSFNTAVLTQIGASNNGGINQAGSFNNATLNQ